MKVDENIQGPTCISDAVFIFLLILIKLIKLTKLPTWPPLLLSSDLRFSSSISLDKRKYQLTSQ